MESNTDFSDVIQELSTQAQLDYQSNISSDEIRENLNADLNNIQQGEE